MSWPLVSVRDLFVAHYGRSLKKEERDESGSHLVYGSSGCIGAHNDSVFDSETIVIGRKGSVGEVIWAPKGGWVIDTAFYLERKIRESIDLRYSYYALKKANLASRTITTSIPGLNRDDLYETKIPLPPLEEQKRIAAILDKADAIRRKRQQAIKLADDFLRSVFLEMFGDPVTNPKGWEVKKFGDVGTLDRGKSKHRPRNDPDLLGGQHPLIQTGDVANSKGYITEYTTTYSDLGLAQSKKWNAGTLCITIAANIAKTGILTFDSCFPDSVVGFLPNELVTVEYIQHWMGFLQKSLEASAPESAQKNINLEILRNIELPIPDFDVQKDFTQVVNKVLEKGERFDLSEESFSNLFFSLSQKAFSGMI